MAETRNVTLASGERVLLRCFVPGRYRLSLSAELFGQIARSGREWGVTIRYIETGDIKCHAGVWTSLREATAEMIDYKRGETGDLIRRRAFESAHIDAECAIVFPRTR